METRKYRYFAILLVSLILALPAQAQQFRVLLYTSPDRWHDPTVPLAVLQFREMAEKHDFELTWAQVHGSGNVTNVFTDEFLANIDVIVFLHSKGADLSTEQMDAFKKFIRNGGGFVGIHGSSASRRQELWFQQLVGRVLTEHPEEQTAVLRVQDKSHPATMHLPDNWVWTEEWYSWGEALTSGQKILLTVDEKTYDPNRMWGDPNRSTVMGDFHPIAWYQEFDGGRSFYTTLGHIPAAYNDPLFLAHIYGGIYWAATGLGIDK